MSLLQAIIAVIKELWDFVFSRKPQLLLPSPRPRVAPILKPTVAHTFVAPAGNQGVIKDDTFLLTRPVISFDGCIQTLRFPEVVTILGAEGDFSRVRVKGVVGWVATRHIEDSSLSTPHFKVGEVYGPAHKETIKLRRFINDVCLGGVLHEPLSSIEFVLWRLAAAGHTPAFGPTRPRLPGSWQTLLKGGLGVYIGIEPKTGSVIEYIKQSGAGWIGYVAAVHPDYSLVLHSINDDAVGEYQEIVVSAAKWREWRPVFISFT